MGQREEGAVKIQSSEAQQGHRAVQVQVELCHGCQTCQLGCSLHHEGCCHIGLARLHVCKDMASYIFHIHICQHCEAPECLEACPSDAMSLDERGAVLIDDDECTRCGICADACPYDAIFYSQSEDRYLKCDLCAEHTGVPLCVALCPTGALKAGDARSVREV